MKRITKTARISITRTQGEWDKINRRVIELGKPDLNTYLRSQIFKLQRKFDECPKCITPAEGIMIQKKHYIPETAIETLFTIALKMKKPVGEIIDELIINPLLLPE